MKYLDLSFPEPAQNLACDEALLDASEESGRGEILRFWESERHFVVAGYSNKIRMEVNEKSCSALNIPVLRRISGGGTVLQGPGCLNYALILDTEARHPQLKDIVATTCFIMNKHREIFESLLKKPVRVQGYSDLASNGLKFSGNAQRRKKRFILFHGTFLLGMDLSWIEKTLPLPSRQPDYRLGRKHDVFLTNLEISRDLVKEALRETWQVNGDKAAADSNRIQELVHSKYSKPEWNFKF
jgi:lipoate---protein ligase